MATIVSWASTPGFYIKREKGGEKFEEGGGRGMETAETKMLTQITSWTP